MLQAKLQNRLAQIVSNRLCGQLLAIPFVGPPGLIALGGCGLIAASPAFAQTVPTPEVPTPQVPTVDIDQLFQPIPVAPAIQAVPLPEVTTVITPQVPTAEFPDFTTGTATLAPPTLTPPPFSGPQFTAPALTAPNLAAPAFAAPNLAAPAFVGFQSTAPQLAPPAFSSPGFNVPNLAAPSLTAPTLNFIGAPENETAIQSPTLPEVSLPEAVSPFGN